MIWSLALGAGASAEADGPGKGARRRPAGDGAGTPADARPEGASLDEEEFTALYHRVARPLRAYLRRLTGDPERADDLLQETFYRFLRADRPPLDDRQRTTYLYRTATRLAQDGWRRAARERRRREAARPEPEGAPPPDRALALDLDRAFRELAPRQRALVWLAGVEGASHREIAEVLGLAETSVKVLLFRARRRLARALDRRGLAAEDLR